MTTLRDPHEQGERLERFRKDAAEERFFEAMNAALATAALPPRATSVDAQRLPIIYVVGVPRSGTTLLSQILSRYLPVGYINNLAARFWRRPSAGIRLSEAVLGPQARRAIGFESSFGATSGIAGPHEFGYFWRHWLDLDAASSHHLSAEEVARVDREGLRQALEAEILAEFASPVVFKNVVCGFHAAFLSSIHPASLFVRVRRDGYDTAASILRARLARYGSYENWWSLKPSTYGTLADMKDPVRQVAGQVAACTAEFDFELSRPGVHTLAVEFEDVCRRPGQIVEAVCAALGRLGANLNPLPDAMPALKPPAAEPLPAEMAKALREHCT